jgi:hypothetical protein
VITQLEWVSMIAGSGASSAAITAVINRRPSMAQVFANNYKDVIERLTKVETRLDSVEHELVAERTAHSRTKDILASALRHIREFTAWVSGPRHSEAPATPADLLKEL